MGRQGGRLHARRVRIHQKVVQALGCLPDCQRHDRGPEPPDVPQLGHPHGRGNEVLVLPGKDKHGDDEEYEGCELSYDGAPGGPNDALPPILDQEYAQGGVDHDLHGDTQGGDQGLFLSEQRSDKDECQEQGGILEGSDFKVDERVLGKFRTDSDEAQQEVPAILKGFIIISNNDDNDNSNSNNNNYKNNNNIDSNNNNNDG